MEKLDPNKIMISLSIALPLIGGGYYVGSEVRGLREQLDTLTRSVVELKTDSKTDIGKVKVDIEKLNIDVTNLKAFRMALEMSGKVMIISPSNQDTSKR